MTAAPSRVQPVDLDRVGFVGRVDEALRLYVAAMGYAPSTGRHRRTLWLEHMNRPGWRAVGALDRAGALIGVAYGYTGTPGQWWFDEVRRGLGSGPSGVPTALADYFELTELHVHPQAQGTGLGEGLLRLLVGEVGSRSVLLSTPEHGSRPPTRAWRLYRRLGFHDVLRRHLFTGDIRPFAVLGRDLPLPPAAR